MDARIHTVARGEWVDRIASQHGTTRSELVRLNPWLAERDDFLIRPGEELRVPGAPPVDDAVEREERAEAPRGEEEVEHRPAPPPPPTRPRIRPERLERPEATRATDLPPPGTPLERPLRQGDEGPLVELLQVTLTERGHPTGQDGDFGPDTYTTVRGFQRANGLGVDGVVGDNTWAVLFRDGPGALDMNEAGADYVRRLRLDVDRANIDDFDQIAIAEAAHARQVLIDAGYAEIAPSVTAELLKAMWFRESHLEPDANEGNGRGLGQITQTGFNGMYAGDYMPRGLRGLGERGWLDLARIQPDAWGGSRSEAWRHFRDNFDDPELNASLSTIWLVAHLMRNSETSHPLREALEDYNGSHLRETYARQVLRLRNGYLEMVRAPADSAS